MKESRKIVATKKLLEAQGDSPESIEATLSLIRIHDQDRKWDAIRSWMGVTTGVAALIVSILVALPTRNNSISSGNDDFIDLAASCPRTYENDLLTFEYPCSWLLTSDENSIVGFTSFSYGGNGGTSGFYYGIDTDVSYLTELPPNCDSGFYFRERVKISGPNNVITEACRSESHGGESLTIPSDRSDSGFVVIRTEPGYLDQIIASLKMK